MISDPLFYAVAVPAVLLAAISKGGFGGGLAMLGVPLLSLVIPAPQAAAIMLPILCLMDVMGVWAYRKTWHRRNFWIMASGALIGIAIGTFTFHWFSDGSIRLLVGCIAVVFSLDYWFRKKPAKANANPDVGRGMFWGALSGFTSFLAHAGGPPANTYLLPQRMDKTLFVGTMVMLFTAVNYAKLLPYWWLGLLPAGNLAMSLILAPLAPVGVVLGIWLHRRISPTWFYRLCYLFLFVTGLKLFYDGVLATLG
ncbi:sulfite exporter TauE/SafE family protein [Shumkonia mesophila]|uniref:sulfite exporter TauE/SafE family protein n=1 Tax=Shumkonia mesophila TaxID=2838854 RepID=UPI00293433BE|nr:sulfite exporter TauE/SafE family protein [Shumkonia mesophila]